MTVKELFRKSAAAFLVGVTGGDMDLINLGFFHSKRNSVVCL